MQQHGGSGRRDYCNLVQHVAESGALADDILEPAFPSNFGLKVNTLFIERAGFAVGLCEVSGVCESYARASHTVLPTLESIRMFLMMAGVCDEFVLVTRSDREAAAW